MWQSIAVVPGIGLAGMAAALGLGGDHAVVLAQSVGWPRAGPR